MPCLRRGGWGRQWRYNARITSHRLSRVAPSPHRCIWSTAVRSWYIQLRTVDSCGARDDGGATTLAADATTQMAGVPHARAPRTRARTNPPARTHLNVLRSPLDHLVHVAVEQFKHEREPARGLVKEHLVQRDDVRVRRQAAQCLDLAEAVHLVDALKHVLHALDRDELAGLGLRLDHLRGGE